MSLLHDSSLILSVLAQVKHFALLSITLPYLQPQLSLPLLPLPFPSSRGHTVSYGTVVVLKASSPLSLNAWLTSTLSLGNSYRSGVDRGGQRCSLPCCKTPGTQQKTVTPAGCSERVIVALVSFGKKALHFKLFQGCQNPYFFKPSRKMFQIFFSAAPCPRPCCPGTNAETSSVTEQWLCDAHTEETVRAVKERMPPGLSWRGSR